MSEFVLRQFRLPAAILASAWAIFIFYGSLLPFEFRSIPFESITRHFLGLGQIETQLPSLTDWVTNIAIFIPLGFFGLGASARGTGRIPTTAGMFITLLGCIIISVGIEFSQIFFPPRNSSILDVIANTLGTLSGIVGWLLFGKKFSALYQTVAALHQVDVRPPVLSKKLQTSLLTGSLLIILAWGGVFTAGWSGWGAAFVKVQSIHFLPFLEHQAADIFLAVTSTLLAALAYGSLGMALWLLNTDCVTPLSTKLRTTTILAMVLAFLMEGIKLFLVAKKPDTGNVIIASLTAGLGYFIAPWIGRIASSKSIDTPAVIAFDSHVNGEATLATRLLVEKTVRFRAGGLWSNPCSLPHGMANRLASHAADPRSSPLDRQVFL
jgi:VanZ family protein